MVAAKTYAYQGQQLTIKQLAALPICAVKAETLRSRLQKHRDSWPSITDALKTPSGSRPPYVAQKVEGELKPHHQRVLALMESGEWYSQRQLQTNRICIMQLVRSGYVRRKYAEGRRCHRSDTGQLYQLKEQSK